MDNQRLSYTVDEALSAMGMGKFQLKLIAYAGVGAVGEAMELMLLSYVGLAAQHDLKLSITEQNLISIFTYVAMLFGAIGWGCVADRYGRKIAIFGSSVLTSVIGLTSTFSQNNLQLLISRILIGLGIGGAQVYTTWYMEFVPRAHRGISMIRFFAFGAIGTVLEAFLAWILMEVIVPEHGWRWLIGLTSFPSIVALLINYYLPESPRFLCTQGRFEEAFRILQTGARINQNDLPEGELVYAHGDQSAQVDAPTERNPNTEEVTVNQTDTVAGSLGTQPINNLVADKKPAKVQDDQADMDLTAGKERSTESHVGNSAASGSEQQPILAAVDQEIVDNLVREIHFIVDSGQTNRTEIEDQSTLNTPLLRRNTETGTERSYPAILMICSRGWRRTTSLIWLLYFTNTFSYSSLVSLLSPSFVVLSIWRHEVHKNPSFYFDALIVSMAELPGLGLAYWKLDQIGRRYTMAIMSGGGFILSLLQIYEWNTIVAMSLVFCTRMFMSATFVALEIYVEEVYPTNLRATGVGLATIAGWIGGMVWPALGDLLGTSHHPILLMSLYAFKIMITGVSALLLPIETLGRELEDNEA